MAGVITPGSVHCVTSEARLARRAFLANPVSSRSGTAASKGALRFLFRLADLLDPRDPVGWSDARLRLSRFGKTATMNISS
jgi:hypothetical protein